MAPTIHAADVEAVLDEHPAVIAAAGVAAPDPLLGEEVAAAVVTTTGVTAEELREWCRARLAPRCAPRHVAFLGELPLGASGKVDKTALRAAFGRGPAGGTAQPEEAQPGRADEAPLLGRIQTAR